MDWASQLLLDCPAWKRTVLISVEQARKIDPSLNDLSDEELQAVLNEQYELGQLAFECWQRKL
jgi:hypothetical protein